MAAKTSAAVPALTIRAPRDQDIAAITALQNLPGYRYGTMRLPFTAESAVKDWLGRQDERRTQVVAERGDKIVGNGGIVRLSGRQSHVATLGMGVHDDHVGQGIGTAILAALLDVADNWWDVRRVELDVYIDNAPAIKLYENFGFEREGVMRDAVFRQGAYVDSVFMARLRKL